MIDTTFLLCLAAPLVIATVLVIEVVARRMAAKHPPEVEVIEDRLDEVGMVREEQLP